jgi:Domain of unknown function (DUF4160)
MPTVAVIDGIKIEFYFDEHPPPHFHAKYAEYRAVIRIDPLKMIYGGLPKAAERKIIAWAKLRTRALHKAWETCRMDGNPGTIK